LSLSSHQKAALAAQIALEKKAYRPVLLDLRELTLIADYFVVCHGNSDVHVRAIVDAIAEGLAQRGETRLSIEGRDDARWMLLDLGDTVVHVFSQADREYYDLERLWGDAPRTELSPS